MLKEYLGRERNGFVITFELMMAMLFVVVVASASVYLTKSLELERYVANVTATTCNMAARYGGNASKAYQVQVNKDGNVGTIEDNANAQIAVVNERFSQFGVSFVNDGGKIISVSDYPDSNGNVRVRVSYQVSSDTSYWGHMVNVIQSVDGSVGRTMEFYMPSLMQNGKLLR